MPSIARRPASVSHERMAAAHERATWGFTSELEHTKDPEWRERLKRKIVESREAAEHFRKLAADARSKGN